MSTEYIEEVVVHPPSATDVHVHRTIGDIRNFMTNASSSPFMGPTRGCNACLLCGQEDACPCHPALVSFPEPILRPNVGKTIVSLLNVHCHHCHSPLVTVAGGGTLSLSTPALPVPNIDLILGLHVGRPLPACNDVRVVLKRILSEILPKETKQWMVAFKKFRQKTNDDLPWRKVTVPISLHSDLFHMIPTNLARSKTPVTMMLAHGPLPDLEVLLTPTASTSVLERVASFRFVVHHMILNLTSLLEHSRAHSHSRRGRSKQRKPSAPASSSPIPELTVRQELGRLWSWEIDFKIALLATVAGACQLESEVKICLENAQQRIRDTMNAFPRIRLPVQLRSANDADFALAQSIQQTQANFQSQAVPEIKSLVKTQQQCLKWIVICQQQVTILKSRMKQLASRRLILVNAYIAEQQDANNPPPRQERPNDTSPEETDLLKTTRVMNWLNAMDGEEECSQEQPTETENQAMSDSEDEDSDSDKDAAEEEQQSRSHLHAWWSHQSLAFSRLYKRRGQVKAVTSSCPSHLRCLPVWDEKEWVQRDSAWGSWLRAPANDKTSFGLLSTSPDSLSDWSSSDVDFPSNATVVCHWASASDQKQGLIFQQTNVPSKLGCLDVRLCSWTATRSGRKFLKRSQQKPVSAIELTDILKRDKINDMACSQTFGGCGHQIRWFAMNGDALTTTRIAYNTLLFSFSPADVLGSYMSTTRAKELLRQLPMSSLETLGYSSTNHPAGLLSREHVFPTSLQQPVLMGLSDLRQGQKHFPNDLKSDFLVLVLEMIRRLDDLTARFKKIYKRQPSLADWIAFPCVRQPSSLMMDMVKTARSARILFTSVVFGTKEEFRFPGQDSILVCHGFLPSDLTTMNLLTGQREPITSEAREEAHRFLDRGGFGGVHRRVLSSGTTDASDHDHKTKSNPRLFRPIKQTTHNTIVPSLTKMLKPTDTIFAMHFNKQNARYRLAGHPLTGSARVILNVGDGDPEFIDVSERIAAQSKIRQTVTADNIDFLKDLLRLAKQRHQEHVKNMKVLLSADKSDLDLGNVFMALDPASSMGALYPAIHSVTRSQTGETIHSVLHDPEALPDADELAIGDVISRSLLNGDVVILNRAPTLRKMSIIAVRVRIVQTKLGSMVAPNAYLLVPINGDCDGDVIHLVYLLDTEDEKFILAFISVRQHLSSTHTGGLSMELVQNGVLVMYQLSTFNTVYSLPMMLRLCQRLTVLTQQATPTTIFNFPARLGQALDLPTIPTDESTFTFGQLSRLFLPRGLFYSRNGLLIENGEWQEGSFRSCHLSNKTSSLTRTILVECGPDVCLQFMSDVSGLGALYTLYFPAGCSWLDFLPVGHVIDDPTQRDALLEQEARTRTEKHKPVFAGLDQGWIDDEDEDGENPPVGLDQESQFRWQVETDPFTQMNQINVQDQRQCQLELDDLLTDHLRTIQRSCRTSLVSLRRSTSDPFQMDEIGSERVAELIRQYDVKLNDLYLQQGYRRHDKIMDMMEKHIQHRLALVSEHPRTTTRPTSPWKTAHLTYNTLVASGARGKVRDIVESFLAIGPKTVFGTMMTRPYEDGYTNRSSIYVRPRNNRLSPTQVQTILQQSLSHSLWPDCLPLLEREVVNRKPYPMEDIHYVQSGFFAGLDVREQEIVCMSGRPCEIKGSSAVPETGEYQQYGAEFAMRARQLSGGLSLMGSSTLSLKADMNDHTSDVHVPWMFEEDPDLLELAWSTLVRVHGSLLPRADHLEHQDLLNLAEEAKGNNHRLYDALWTWTQSRYQQLSSLAFRRRLVVAQTMAFTQWALTHSRIREPPLALVSVPALVRRLQTSDPSLATDASPPPSSEQCERALDDLIESLVTINYGALGDHPSFFRRRLQEAEPILLAYLFWQLSPEQVLTVHQLTQKQHQAVLEAIKTLFRQTRVPDNARTLADANSAIYHDKTQAMLNTKHQKRVSVEDRLTDGKALNALVSFTEPRQTMTFCRFQPRQVSLEGTDCHLTQCIQYEMDALRSIGPQRLLADLAWEDLLDETSVVSDLDQEHLQLQAFAREHSEDLSPLFTVGEKEKTIIPLDLVSKSAVRVTLGEQLWLLFPSMTFHNHIEALHTLLGRLTSSGGQPLMRTTFRFRCSPGPNRRRVQMIIYVQLRKRFSGQFTLNCQQWRLHPVIRDLLSERQASQWVSQPPHDSNQLSREFHAARTVSWSSLDLENDQQVLAWLIFEFQHQCHLLARRKLIRSKVDTNQGLEWTEDEEQSSLVPVPIHVYLPTFEDDWTAGRLMIMKGPLEDNNAVRTYALQDKMAADENSLELKTFSKDDWLSFPDEAVFEAFLMLQERDLSHDTLDQLDTATTIMDMTVPTQEPDQSSVGSSSSSSTTESSQSSSPSVYDHELSELTILHALFDGGHQIKDQDLAKTLLKSKKLHDGLKINFSWKVARSSSDSAFHALHSVVFHNLQHFLKTLLCPSMGIAKVNTLEPERPFDNNLVMEANPNVKSPTYLERLLSLPFINSQRLVHSNTIQVLKAVGRMTAHDNHLTNVQAVVRATGNNHICHAKNLVDALTHSMCPLNASSTIKNNAKNLTRLLLSQGSGRNIAKGMMTGMKTDEVDMMTPKILGRVDLQTLLKKKE